MNIPASLKKFLLYGAVIFVVWEILYIFFLGPNHLLDDYLTMLVVQAGVAVLDIIGEDAAYSGTQVLLSGIPSVVVGYPCNGLETTVLFVGFILATPGKIIDKFWFSILGVATILLLNSVRVAALAITHRDFSAYFDFHHKYTYTLIVYGVIFLFWRWWVNNYTQGFLEQTDGNES